MSGPAHGARARRPLVIVGAGGFARETAALVEAINDQSSTWDLLGYADDSPALAGTMLSGRPVLGPAEIVHELTDAAVVICIGNPRNYGSRARVVDRLALAPERYTTLVHPGAHVARSVAIGEGTVVHATSVLTADITVGAHVAIMPGVVLTHDDVIGDFATFGSGVRISGGVEIGEGAYVGAGALVRENLTVGAWSTVGMGALVTRPIPPAEVWMGVPARYVRAAPTPGRPIAGGVDGGMSAVTTCC
ncbi:MAG: acetyltransferase [Acidimicrobiales bacterium]